MKPVHKSLASALVALALAVPAAAVTVIGTNAPETIYGTVRSDRIDGKGGDDRIFAFAGNDVVTGGAGADRIEGSGQRRVRARDGRKDVVSCGPGKDTAVVDGRTPSVAARSCVGPPLRRRRLRLSRRPVALENQKPGTPGWASFGVAPGRAIEGYTVPSARPGETITFHVSAEPEASYRILVYRIGWYGGVGARLVSCLLLRSQLGGADEAGGAGGRASALSTAGPRATPRDPAGLGLLLPRSLPAHERPYCGQLERQLADRPRGTGTRRAPLLVQAGVSTWQAYNGWGGGSLYPFNSPGGNRAAKVAFDRPVERQSLKRAFEWDAPLVLFLERQGFDVSYQADLDTARDPSTLEGRQCGRRRGPQRVLGEGSARRLRARARPARASPFSAPTPRTGRCGTRTTSARSSGTRARPGTRDRPAARDRPPRALVPPRYECGLMGVQHQGGDLAWQVHGDYTVPPGAATDPWLRAAGLARVTSEESSAARSTRFPAT